MQTSISLCEGVTVSSVYGISLLHYTGHSAAQCLVITSSNCSCHLWVYVHLHTKYRSNRIWDGWEPMLSGCWYTTSIISWLQTSLESPCSNADSRAPVLNWNVYACSSLHVIYRHSILFVYLYGSWRIPMSNVFKNFQRDHLIDESVNCILSLSSHKSVDPPRQWVNISTAKEPELLEG